MFLCSSCHYGSPMKLGKCPSCGAFASFIEQIENTTSIKVWWKKACRILSSQSDTQKHEQKTFPLSLPEFIRVIGPAIMASAVYLLAGEPGIGKSTMVLQIVHDLKKNTPTIRRSYCSGEETSKQVMTRYTRLGGDAGQADHCFHTTSVDDIIATMQSGSYDIMIIDSIQTMQSQSYDGIMGTPWQIKACSEALHQAAKDTQTTLIIIGHVTKGGDIAWPKYLEHIVDVVLYLEGERLGEYRFLRNYKNRFGHADETGIFGMTAQWLTPVYDMSKLTDWQQSLPGVVWTMGIDNGRPLLVKLEVLLAKSYRSFPERQCIGVDHKRVDLIIAIMQRYLGYKLHQYDIFVNIPGELRLHDSGIDLAIMAAIRSQYTNAPVPEKTIWIGELSLSGQITASRLHAKRIKEAPKSRHIMDHQVMKTVREVE